MKKRMIAVVLAMVMVMTSGLSVFAASGSNSGTYNGIRYILDGYRTSEQAYSIGDYNSSSVSYYVYIRAYIRGNDDATETSVLRYDQGKRIVTTPTIGAPNDSYIDSIYTYLQFGTTRVGAFWV